MSLALLSLAACGSGCAHSNDAQRGWRPEAPPLAANAVASGDASVAGSAVGNAGYAARMLQTLDLSGATLEELIHVALRSNRALLATREDRIAASERSPQVRALPDPRLSARYFVEEVETRVGPQELALGIHQRLPWPGDLQRADAVVEARTRAAGAASRLLERRVARDVRVAWVERWELEERIAVVAKSRALFETLQEVLRPLYASGSARYTDIVRTAVEIGRLQDRERSLADRRRVLDARMNALLGRAPGSSLPPASTPPTVGIPALSVSESNVLAEALQVDPTLEALAHELAARTAEQTEAEHARGPDLTVGIEWISTGSARAAGVSGSGDDPIAATLALDLPLQAGRYEAREREARARVRAAAERLAGAQDELSRRCEEELYQLRDARRRIELFDEELIPRAAEAVEATQVAFRASTSTLTDVVDTERIRLELELELAKARADYAIARARVWELAGPDEQFEPDSGSTVPHAEAERGTP